MLSEHEPHEIRAQSPRGQRADQNGCIEKYLHDTSAFTSSSVTNPCASAKGIIRSRNCSNCINASCRRKASRATSLRVRPDCSQTRSRRLSSSGSRRIVIAYFMISSPYDNVIHNRRSFLKSQVNSQVTINQSGIRIPWFRIKKDEQENKPCSSRISTLAKGIKTPRRSPSKVWVFRARYRRSFHRQDADCGPEGTQRWRWRCGR